MTMPRVSEEETVDQRNAQIRSAFVARGTSFHAWCLTSGINPNNARKAVIGKWTGPKARQLVSQIMFAAGLKE